MRRRDHLSAVTVSCGCRMNACRSAHLSFRTAVRNENGKLFSRIWSHPTGGLLLRVQPRAFKGPDVVRLLKHLPRARYQTNSWLSATIRLRHQLAILKASTRHARGLPGLATYVEINRLHTPASDRGVRRLAAAAQFPRGAHHCERRPGAAARTGRDPVGPG